MEFTWTVQQHQTPDPVQNNTGHTTEPEESSVIGHSAARRLLAIAG